jgi:tripartite-type tricarboxylate transporter receptor subunit TctC
VTHFNRLGADGFLAGQAPDTEHAMSTGCLSARFLSARVLPRIAAAFVPTRGVAAAERSAAGEWPPAAPDIPTAAEAGYPQFTSGGLPGMFGARDMPAELRERIAADMRDVLVIPPVIATPVIATPANLGMAAHNATPSEFAAILDEQRAQWAAIAQDYVIEPVHQIC